MFSIQIPYLSLKQTYLSMQCMRWKVYNNFKTAIIVDNDKILKVEQNKEMFYFHCSEDEFFNHWYNYFDVQTDYEKLINLDHDNYVKWCLSNCNGSRVLNQNKWQVLIESIFLNHNDLKSAKINYHKFCKSFGKTRKKTINGMLYFWNETPTIHEVVEKWDHQSDIVKSLNGALNVYECACKMIANEVDLCNKESIESKVFLLCSLNNQDIKDRVLFYGYQNYDRYPNSDQLSSIIWDKYGESDKDTFYGWDMDAYRGYRGLACHYMVASYNVLESERRGNKWDY